MTEAVISSSVLIGIIILIRTVFKGRIKSSVIYSLWLIAAVRLILPFEMASSPVSVMNIARDMLPQAQVTEEESENSPAAVRNEAVSHEAVSHEAEPYIPGDVTDKLREGDRPLSERKIFSFVPIRRFITAVMLLWFTAVNILYAAALRKSRTAFPHTSPLPVYTTPDMVSPCIFGLFFPAIYINEGSAEDDEAVGYIVAHELCHYYHGDLIWTVLRYVLLSVYWFDPFVWAAAILSKRDCECACDEAAVRMLGEEHRFRYGKAIIDLIPQKSSESFGVVSTSMASGLNVLKERMRLIASKPANRIWAVAVSIAAVILTAFSTFTSAQDIEAAAVANDISEPEDIPRDRISAAVTDRNGNEHEIVYYPAPYGYEPYIYMNEYLTAGERSYNAESFGQFLDSACFSAADVTLDNSNFTVDRQTDTDMFYSLFSALKNKELAGADFTMPAEPIAQISFYRANGGFSSSLHIGIFTGGSRKTAVVTGDDMNRLTEMVTGGVIPTEAELAQAYNDSVHFEAAFDGGELYDLLYSLSPDSGGGEPDIPDYPPFSPDSFSENIAERLSVSGQVPQGFVQKSVGNIVFAVPYRGSVNEFGSTFLWQSGSADFKLLSDKPDIPDNAEEINGEFCSSPCKLFINDGNMQLLFSDSEENVYCASVSFASDEEKETALKILGSIHIE